MPASFRWASALAVVFSFHIAFMSLSQLHQTMQPSGNQLTERESTLSQFKLSPPAIRETALAWSSGELSALVGMKPWRSVTLLGLAVAGGVTFFLTMRLRMSSRNKARTAVLLSRAAVAVAVLRVIDAAEMLAIIRSVYSAVEKPLVAAQMLDADVVEAFFRLTAVAYVGFSFVMASIFVIVSSYFGSETLQAGLARIDAAAPPDDSH